MTRLGGTRDMPCKVLELCIITRVLSNMQFFWVLGPKLLRVGFYYDPKPIIIIIMIIQNPKSSDLFGCGQGPKEF